MTIDRAKFIRFGYLCVSFYVAFSVLVILLERTSLRTSFIDFSAAYAGFSLFFVMPIAIVTLFVFNRKCRTIHTHIQRLLMRSAMGVFILIWLFSWVPMLAVMSLPTPVEHDQPSAYQGFIEHMGFSPPSSVSNIQYQTYIGLQDMTVRLRFHTADTDIINQIIKHNKLEEIEFKPNLGLSDSTAPSWWHDKKGRNRLKLYKREITNSYYWYLWYDLETGIAWYEEFSV